MAGSASGRPSAGEDSAANLRHALVIWWSDEDAGFVAEVPELPGCAADGATYEEAVANVRQVMAEWIETARSLGRPVPSPKGRLLFA